MKVEQTQDAGLARNEGLVSAQRAITPLRYFAFMAE
jgi:hypothetical protein